MIESLILNQFAKRKLAPYRLIKKRAENEGTLISQPIIQLHSNQFIPYISGQTLKPYLSLKSNHSLTTQFQIQSDRQNRKIHSLKYQNQHNERRPDKIKKQNIKELTGGFIPKQQKGERLSSAEHTNKNQWQGESDQEESLSDLHWHKRPANKKQSDTKQKPATIKYAREKIKQKPATFPKIVFDDSTEGSSK